jgi:HEAT repeat protein
MECRPVLPVLLALFGMLCSAAAAQEEFRVGQITGKELVAILKTDKEARKRRAAAQLLERIGPIYRDGLAAVATAVKEDSDPAVREAAAQSLANMAAKSHDIREKAHDAKEKELRERATEDRDIALAVLRDVLKSEKAAPRVREAAATALGRIGTEKKADAAINDKSLIASFKASAPLLIDALKDSDAGARAAAAESLGRLAEYAEEAVPALIAALSDKTAPRLVRSNAAYALGRIGGEAARPAARPLADALTDAAAPVEVRRSAADALGALKNGAAEGVPALGKALKDPAVVVRRAAVTALGKVGTAAREALSALVEASRDEDKFVRSQAYFVLGGLPDDASEIVPVLVNGMKDQFLDVRLAAIEALGRLGPAAKAAVPALQAATRDAQSAIRDAASEALKKVEPKP